MIYIASDHAGFRLKSKFIQYLSEQNYDVVDLGTNSEDSVDYPEFAKKLINELYKDQNSRGILICGTGIGMSIAANRFPKIYAALCNDEISAEFSRKHNNSNVLIVGARVTNTSKAVKILQIWLKTEFEANRHLERIKKIETLRIK